MLSIMLRHYRRFAVFSGGLALFCTAQVIGAGFQLPLVGLLAVFALLGLLFMVAAVGVYLWAPHIRGLLEIIGASGFICAAILFYAHRFGVDGLVQGLGGALLLIAMAGGLWSLLHSKWSRKIGTQTTWRDRHSGHVNYPARLIWRHVVPGAAEPSDHCTGMMARYDEDDEDADTVHLTFKGRKDRAAQYTVTFLERDHPASCRFFFQGTEADGTVVDGIFSLRITVLERDACFVSCVEERCGLSLGRLVERWFDDALGYQHDKLIEMLDARYGETYGAGKPDVIVAE